MIPPDEIVDEVCDAAKSWYRMRQEPKADGRSKRGMKQAALMTQCEARLVEAIANMIAWERK